MDLAFDHVNSDLQDAMMYMFRSPILVKFNINARNPTDKVSILTLMELPYPSQTCTLCS